MTIKLIKNDEGGIDGFAEDSDETEEGYDGKSQISASAVVADKANKTEPFVDKRQANRAYKKKYFEDETSEEKDKDEYEIEKV